MFFAPNTNTHLLLLLLIMWNRYTHTLSLSLSMCVHNICHVHIDFNAYNSLKIIQSAQKKKRKTEARASKMQRDNFRRIDKSIVMTHRFLYVIETSAKFSRLKILRQHQKKLICFNKNEWCSCRKLTSSELTKHEISESCLHFECSYAVRTHTALSHTHLHTYTHPPIEYIQCCSGQFANRWHATLISINAVRFVIKYKSKCRHNNLKMLDENICSWSQLIHCSVRGGERSHSAMCNTKC